MAVTVITGGAGYIGSTLAEALQSRGDDVHVIDNFSTGREEFLTDFKGTVHRLDLTDETSQLEPIFEGAETVYHLAANVFELINELPEGTCAAPDMGITTGTISDQCDVKCHCSVE